MKIKKFPPQNGNTIIEEDLDLLLNESFSSQEVLDVQFNKQVLAELKLEGKKGWFNKLNLKGRRLAIAAAGILLIFGFSMFGQPLMNAVAEATQKIVIFVNGGGEFSVSSQYINKRGEVIKPNKEYKVDDYDKLIRDVKELPYKSYLPPVYIPQGYKYTDAAYFLMDDSTLVEDTTLFSADRHTLQIFYRNNTSSYAVDENIEVKKDILQKLSKKEADPLNNSTKLLIPGLIMSKVDFDNKKAILGIREDKETITQLLMVPVEHGYITAAYNSKIDAYNILTNGEKNEIKDNLFKIAKSMIEK